MSQTCRHGFSRRRFLAPVFIIISRGFPLAVSFRLSYCLKNKYRTHTTKEPKMNELLVFTVAMLAARVAGHGYLMDPPARNSAWRTYSELLPNYVDTQLNCGGMAVSFLIISISCYSTKTRRWRIRQMKYCITCIFRHHKRELINTILTRPCRLNPLEHQFYNWYYREMHYFLFLIFVQNIQCG